jgi:NodT family efflux transporter outer membrane factor (OMF) lipoprotein
MKKIFIVLILVLAAGCSLVPQFHRPEMKMPEHWRDEKSAAVTDLTNWWRNFKNPELSALEQQALLQNLDLQAARARIDQARAARKIVGGALFPQADVSASAARTGGSSATHRSTGSAGANISYELDLFGANRAAKIAAEAGVESSLFDRQALVLIVSADVAETYAGALALRGRIYVAEQGRANAQRTLDILQARFNAGATSALEVEQQKTALANVDASIAAFENSLSVTMDALAVLLGENPQSFKIIFHSLGDLEVPTIAPGQPSALLERRPDIREAEAELVAANADIGVARAAFFPSINLGLAGSISKTPLSNPATTALSLASSLSAPLFRGGSLQGGLEKSKARENELAENYRHTVLTAFQEVEDALAAVKSADKRRIAYTDAVRSADKAYGIATLQFKAGAVDYTSLLDSERSLLSAKDNLVSANLDRLTAVIGLYKALGGGWAAR